MPTTCSPPRACVRFNEIGVRRIRATHAREALERALDGDRAPPAADHVPVRGPLRGGRRRAALDRPWARHALHRRATSTAGWSSRPASARSRRSWTATAAARTGASALPDGRDAAPRYPAGPAPVGCARLGPRRRVRERLHAPGPRLSCHEACAAVRRPREEVSIRFLEHRVLRRAERRHGREVAALDPSFANVIGTTAERDVGRIREPPRRRHPGSESAASRSASVSGSQRRRPLHGGRAGSAPRQPPPEFATCGRNPSGERRAGSRSPSRRPRGREQPAEEARAPRCGR